MIVLHSIHSNESKDFIETYKDDVSLVIDWYGDVSSYKQYMLSGNPSPSGFPFVVYNKKGFVNPESPQWVKDEVNGLHLTEQEKLNKMTSLSKLSVLEALDGLPDERVKFDILMQNALFLERWNATVDLDLGHPLTVQALGEVGIDVDSIKKEILGI